MLLETPVLRLEMISLVLMLSWGASSIDPETGGTVQRLLSQQETLIQPGLSFINSSNMASVSMMSLNDIHNTTTSHHILSCSINIVNWSRWLLGYPVHFFKYGHFKQGKRKIIFIIVGKYLYLKYIGIVIGSTIMSYLLILQLPLNLYILHTTFTSLGIKL